MRFPVTPLLMVAALISPLWTGEAAPFGSHPHVASALPGVANQHPNEPAGYVPFAENRCDRLPSFPRSASGLRGLWYSYPPRSRNLSLGTDPGAPESPPGVCVTIYRRGLQGGNGPVDWGGWDSVWGRERKSLYLSLWIKIDGAGFENHPTGTKLGFLGYGARQEGGGDNQGFFFLKGNGRQAVGDRFRLEFRQQDIPQPGGRVVRNLLQNVDRSPRMTTGAWHHWEAVFELNAPGSPNGVFKMWIDNVQIMDYHDVVYVTPRLQSGFYLWKWNPTWGGKHGVFRTRDDRILIDDVYLSGLPLRQEADQE